MEIIQESCEYPISVSTFFTPEKWRIYLYSAVFSTGSTGFTTTTNDFIIYNIIPRFQMREVESV